MRTAIIDKSLVDLNFHENARKADVYLYVCSLFEAGADYVEVDTNALLHLPKPSGNENYIYRIKTQDEYLVANAFEFSYVVVPLSLSYIISNIVTPVILEIKIGDVDILSLLQVVHENVNLENVSLIRLVGDFKMSPDELANMILKYKRRFIIPIDICAEDNSMTALSVAISAYAANANSITVAFGDDNNYASLEELIITLATMYKITVNDNYIVGICKAVLFSAAFCDIRYDNLEIIMKHYQIKHRKINIVDMSPDENTGVSFKKIKNQYKSVIEKQLIKMELENDVTDEITEIIKKSSVNFFEFDDKNRKIMQ